jgi:hypothetical protein
MRAARTAIDWFPTVLASAAVLAKLLAMLTLFSGAPFAGLLLIFTIFDPLPWWIAETARTVFVDTRGSAPRLAPVMFVYAIVLLFTAIQWYAIGAIVGRVVAGHATSATTMSLR